MSGNYKVERRGKAELGTSRCRPFAVCVGAFQSCVLSLDPHQRVHADTSTQKIGTADLGPGRGQRQPKRKHVSAWRMSWAMEPADASLVEESGTRRRGEGPVVRGEGVGLLEGEILSGILSAQQYPLSPTLPIKLRA